MKTGIATRPEAAALRWWERAERDRGGEREEHPAADPLQDVDNNQQRFATAHTESA